ncbi:tyrosine-type recombinase/integrase [Curtobacterium sp. NPDC089185]|uniref:tyrosine-type recombinase/integrase n=1 Tax=Curtobacterium sp. NPDC089185 TaxID=3154968 RepID=UPI00343D41D9
MDPLRGRWHAPTEVQQLAAALDAQPPYGLMVRLAAYTGRRAGDLAALRVRDVELLHKEVRVHQNMTHTSAGYVVGVPKTANSKREVPILVDSLLHEVRDYLAQHPHRSDPNAGLWPGKVEGHPS